MRSIGIEHRSGRELVRNIGDSTTNGSPFVVVIVVVVVVAVAADANVSDECNAGR